MRGRQGALEGLLREGALGGACVVGLEGAQGGRLRALTQGGPLLLLLLLSHAGRAIYHLHSGWW